MAGRTRTHVPIVLPTVQIQVGTDGALAVMVDNEPYALSPGFSRDQVRGLLQDLADDLGPIRVEITESNGERYVDIQTPGDRDPAHPEPMPGPPAPSGIGGQFNSREGVLVAVVVARRAADADGTVAVRLPPAFLQRYGDSVLLIRQTTLTQAALADGSKVMGP